VLFNIFAAKWRVLFI